MNRLTYGYREDSMGATVEALARLGYRPTEHGTYQRGLWSAVKLTPVGSGVVVRKAWTTAQVISLGVVLTLIGIFVCGG